jgi:outer membrane lipoprotein-sorting protein
MRRLIASCSVVLLSIALLGACGGSSDKPAASNAAPSLTVPDGNGSSSNFSKLYEDALKQKFKITFVDDSGDETTYAQDGNGKSMYSSGDTQTFISADETVRCNTNSDGKAECTKVLVGTSVNPFLGIYNAGKAFVTALARFGDKSSETIAGRDADCVTFSKKTVEDAGPIGAAIGSAIKGSITYCVDKETGVLLEYSTKDADGKTTDSFKVTKFEEPSDSDFEPPATPSTGPDFTVPSITYPPGYTGPTIPGPG